MNFVSKLKSFLMEPIRLYLTGLSILGIVTFILNTKFISYTPSEWILVYALVGSILLLNHVTFQASPRG